MAYLPKSKYTVSYATPGKFKTEDGESYAGSSPDSLDKPLVSLEKSTDKVLQVVPGRRIPTEAEYKQGSMQRYFRQDLRTMKVDELTPDNYDRSQREIQPDYYTFATGSWILTGSLDDYLIGGFMCIGVRKLNQETINSLEKILPGIISSKILYNPDQFVRETL